MYLWHVLHRDETELIRKIYSSQKCDKNRGDWVNLIEEERQKYQIEESDEQIAVMSKECFKTFVNLKIKAYARN